MTKLTRFGLLTLVLATLASAGAAVADQARPPRAVERLEQRDLARVERKGLWVLHGVSVGRFDATPGCRGDPIW